jgi:hypothetical protein
MGLLDRLLALFGRSTEPESDASATVDAERAVVDEGRAEAHDLGLAGQIASQGSPTGVPSLADRPISTEHGAPPTDETAELEAGTDRDADDD